jgi:hypothetical protein
LGLAQLTGYQASAAPPLIQRADPVTVLDMRLGLAICSGQPFCNLRPFLLKRAKVIDSVLHPIKFLRYRHVQSSTRFKA